MNGVTMMSSEPAVLTPQIQLSPKNPGSAGSAESTENKSEAGVAPINQSTVDLHSNLATTSEPPQAEEKLRQAVQQINDALMKDGRTLQFSVDKGTGMTIVQIREKSTNEVIRQIPSEETLKLANNLETHGAVLFTGKA